MVSFTIEHNVRVYEPLRRQCAYLSRYTKVTKRTTLRKPFASNGLYTLLGIVDITLGFSFLVTWQRGIRVKYQSERHF